MRGYPLKRDGELTWWSNQVSEESEHNVKILSASEVTERSKYAQE